MILIAVVPMVIAVVVGVAGMFLGGAGYIILRDRGHGTVRSWVAVFIPALLAGIGAAVAGIAVSPAHLGTYAATAGMLLGMGAVGALGWVVARAVPARPRRDGGPRRRFRYGRWGVVVGAATVPLCAVQWWVGGWRHALLPGPVPTLSTMFALLALEARARNRLDDDADLGTFVLSLRSFADDLKLTIKAGRAESTWAHTSNSNYVNLEQFIADEVGRRIGRLVALGSPRDKLPAGGAGRLYAPEARWPERVEALAVAARAIVMQVGGSRPLGEELAIIRRRGLETKLFILTCPAGRSGVLMRRYWQLMPRLLGWPEFTWSDFAALLERNGYDPGAGDPGPGAVVAFDERGSRIDVRRGCRTPADYADAMADRLAAASATPRPRPR